MRSGSLFSYEPFKKPDDDGHRHFFYLIRKDPVASLAMQAWCTATLGPRPGAARDGRWWEAHGQFVWIRSDDDAFLFRMRWC